MKPHTIIAMDGQGNVDFRDEQEFTSLEIAQRVADDMNALAEREGSDWHYMPMPVIS